MNFLNNLYKKSIFFIFLILFNINFFKISGQIHELGTPYIQKIIPKEYSFKNQNYSIVQDNRGILYIGNLNGVLEYDGTFWRQIKIKGIPYLAIDKNNKIYVGGYNEFGYLAPDKLNKLTFVSLLDKSNIVFSHFGQIQNVIACENEVLFCTENKLFRWKNNKIEALDTDDSHIKTFKLNEKVYIYKDPIGLMSYSDGKFIPLPKGDFFKGKPILDILPFEEKLLIKIQNNKGFILYDSNSIAQFNTKVDEFISQNEFTKGEILLNGYYAFGTKKSGIVIINNKGELINSIHVENGLLDESISNLYADKNNNLWVLHNNGLSRIEIPSPFTYFDKSSGISGNVSSIIRHNGKIYLATSQGVFYFSNNRTSSDILNLPDNQKFKPVEEIFAKCNTFFSYNSSLFVSSAKGLFEIKNIKAKLIVKGDFETAVQSKIDSSLFYLGGSNGISAIKFTDGKYMELENISNINYHIQTIAEEQDGTLWLATDYSGVIRINQLTNFDRAANFQQYISENGLPEEYEWINVHSISEDILFSTSKGIFRFDKNYNEFFLDTVIGIDFSKGNRWVYPIVQDNDKNLWIGSGNNDKLQKQIEVAYYNGENKKPILQTLPLKRIQNFNINSIFPDENKIIWFGGSNRLIRFDTKMKREDHSKFFTLIHKVVIGNDSVVCYGNHFDQGKKQLSDKNDLNPKFSYSLNTIHFEFASTHYESEDKILHQFFLEGPDKGWSSWSSDNYKEYTNLPEGDYIFKVRSKNIYGDLSNEANYQFKFSPPVYKTWWAYFIYVVFGSLFLLIIARWRSYRLAKEKYILENIINERTEELVKAKEESEKLLANVLPKDTAAEIKSKGRASSHKYQMVTVLFSDIQGFTKIAEHMNPETLIDLLDNFFFNFDMVVEKYNIEKIKTIGDAYMCAGGIPYKNRTNPVEVVLAALEMQQHIKNLQIESQTTNASIWDLRIGIHTGPIIAGVVGQKKLSYDIWGDTVNIASRMESSGEIGKVNISGITYELVKDFFICEYRGKMPVKYKGKIDMYFVKGFRPELSDNLKRMRNKIFHLQLQLLRLNDFEEMILDKLKKELPKNLYFHNLKHVINVYTQVELIGRAEGISQEEMLLIRTAGLLHDFGFIKEYDRNEEIGCEFAGKILPDYKYSNIQIDTICELIMATQTPPKPKNLLEQIICDANLDYLGRVDFISLLKSLFKELQEQNKIKSEKEWYQLQIQFIKDHQFFTKTAQRLRDVDEKTQIKNIKKLIKSL